MSAHQKAPPTLRPTFQRNGGAPLPSSVRSKMESSFGTDFGAVRVDQSRDPLPYDAEAYALGDRIRFAPGNYQPESRKGQELLGHELAHVVQQRQGKVASDVALGKHRGSLNSGLEGEADAMGRAAAEGRSATSGDVPDAVAPHAAVVQMKPSIKGTPKSTAKKHPLSVLNDEFKTQLNDYPYTIQNGKQVKPSEFITNANDLGDTIKRPEKIEATVEGARRQKGSRQAQKPQTEIGNLGEHERAMFGRPITSKFTYAGGHLISDKILDAASYRSDNLAPQLREFNAPGWRVMEQMAEDGPYDTTTNKLDKSVPIDMTVEVSYPDDSYKVDVADLVAWNVIPNTVTQTDGGATSITIPRRVPNKWKATLKIDDTTYPNHVLRESDVPPEPEKHLAGTDMDVDDVTKNPSLDRQPSQAYAFGQSSVVKSSTGKYKVGGKTTETVVGYQAYPRTKAAQPFGAVSVITPTAAVVNPTFLPSKVPASDFWEQPTSKKRKVALDELESVTDKKFRDVFDKATAYHPKPKTHADWKKFVSSSSVKSKAKRQADKNYIKKLQVDTNVTGLV